MQKFNFRASTNPCLITGCRLIIAAEGKSLWGDLHMQGDMFVFVGNFDADAGVARWERAYLEEGSSPGERQITLLSDRKYFERRGIIVLHPLDCFYSDATVKHFERWLNA